MRSAVELEAGTVAYSESGPADAPPVVFVHGAFVDGTLWRKVVPGLDDSFRCIVPDLPLGSTPHADARGRRPLAHALAKLLADLIAALELEDVTLVGNDTGGAICQIDDHPPPRAARAPGAHAVRRVRELPAPGVSLPPAARADPWRRCLGGRVDADPGNAPNAARIRLAGETADPGRSACRVDRSDHIRKPTFAATRARSCEGSPSATRSRPRPAP